jgi:1,4-alpha-glucan branching enzyme
MDRVESLRVVPPERRVPVVVDAPLAREVILTGDFTGWSAEGIRLRRGSDGRWGTVLRLLPGQYEYRLIIDGDWADHPGAPKRNPNSFGVTNCILEVAKRII